jgi:cytochrome c
MDSFELNKIAGAVFFTLLVYLGVQNLGDILFETEPANPQAYVVEGVAEEGVVAVATVEEVVPMAQLLQTASIEKGMKTAKKCVSCHSFDNGGGNKIGPALYGVVDRSVGVVDGFKYSNALGSMGGNWDYEALSGFLENPKAYAKGTNMAFAGLRKASDRANIITYLDSLK